MLSPHETGIYTTICTRVLTKPSIHQKLEEIKEKTLRTGKEHAFNVCSDGRITELIEGTDKNVSVSAIDRIDRECNNQVDLTVHSHPHADSYPSKGDFIGDLTSQPKIASCIYGAKNDMVTCYRTSDELRNKYRTKILDEREKVSRLSVLYERAIDSKNTSPKKKEKLHNELEQEKNNYLNLLSNVAKEIVSNIYPDLKYGTISPYPDVCDDYCKDINHSRRYGKYDDVWVSKCYDVFR